MPNHKMKKNNLYKEIYPVCGKIIPEEKFAQLASLTGSPEMFADILLEAVAQEQVPEYLGELARLEFVVANLKADAGHIPAHTSKPSINPTLQIFENSWLNLTSLLEEAKAALEPVKGKETIIIWHHPVNGSITARPVNDEDLLVLKMVLEELSVHAVAQEGGIHAAAVEVAVIRALKEGIITGPESGIRRDSSVAPSEDVDPAFLAADIFTLQWHITQACDLHCRHCYDRSHYKPLSLKQERAILDDFTGFCRTHNVHGQVTFTGGNPLLHKNFEQLYKKASDCGLSIAILGNPTTREQIERLNDIQPLSFYQVSLEGLEEHNDYMRGRGHFKRVLAFLDVLKDAGVYSMVMLTLTRENMTQVLELAEILRNKADLFTFNRLSLTGEGANLIEVDPEAYPAFLKAYVDAADSNECLGWKDNFLNIIFEEQGRKLCGGCTGYGCGAAFNFMAVLADGTVHACRKFPSPIGNIMELSLSQIYHSDLAKRYRGGAAECRDCRLYYVCRGCLAVAHSHGLDIFSQKDPYCFMK